MIPTASPSRTGLSLSVVIPAYNEEQTLPGHLDTLLPVLCRLCGDSWEVLVVDDGSGDRTAAVVRARGDERILLLSHRPNRGKGVAVKTGVLASRGDAVLVCDADMATPPEMLETFLQELGKGADLVIGNRKSPEARITLPQTPLRRFLGSGFIRLARLVTATAFADYNCGFKLLRGSAARDLFTAVQTGGWGYDIEVLGLAVRRGYRVTEHPVEWRHGDNSCVRLPGDLFKTLRELALIRNRLQREARRGL